MHLLLPLPGGGNLSQGLNNCNPGGWDVYEIVSSLSAPAGAALAAPATATAALTALTALSAAVAIAAAVALPVIPPFYCAAGARRCYSRPADAVVDASAP